jgi:hypothetical protein
VQWKLTPSDNRSDSCAHLLLLLLMLMLMLYLTPVSR